MFNKADDIDFADVADNTLALTEETDALSICTLSFMKFLHPYTLNHSKLVVLMNDTT